MTTVVRRLQVNSNCDQ